VSGLQDHWNSDGEQLRQVREQLTAAQAAFEEEERLHIETSTKLYKAQAEVAETKRAAAVEVREKLALQAEVTELRRHIDEMNDDAGRYFKRVESAESRACTPAERAVLEAISSLHLERVGASWVIGAASAACPTTLAQLIVSELARRSGDRRCRHCKGPHPVSDAVAQENPFCAACLPERVARRATREQPAGEFKATGATSESEHIASEYAAGRVPVATMGKPAPVSGAKESNDG
jgi:hypothetical protein